jgi:hypothetical protein
MTKTLERLIKRYAQFDHALLATLKQSAIEELRTVKAAFDSEICMAQYDSPSRWSRSTASRRRSVCGATTSTA